jgi:hypothetical protein
LQSNQQLGPAEWAKFIEIDKDGVITVSQNTVGLKPKDEPKIWELWVAASTGGNSVGYKAIVLNITAPDPAAAPTFSTSLAPHYFYVNKGGIDQKAEGTTETFTLPSMLQAAGKSLEIETQLLTAFSNRGLVEVKSGTKDGKGFVSLTVDYAKVSQSDYGEHELRITLRDPDYTNGFNYTMHYQTFSITNRTLEATSTIELTTEDQDKRTEVRTFTDENRLMSEFKVSIYKDGSLEVEDVEQRTASDNDESGLNLAQTQRSRL